MVNRLRVALREWVMHGTPPPASQWPTLAPIQSQNDRHDWDDDDDDDDGHGWGHHGRHHHHHGHHQHWKPLLVEPTMKAMGLPERRPGHSGIDLQGGELHLPGVDYNWVGTTTTAKRTDTDQRPAARSGT